MHFLNSHGFRFSLTWVSMTHLHIQDFTFFFTLVSSFHMFTLYTYTFTCHLHIYTWSHTLYTLHFTHILGAVTHSPNHQRRTQTHHITQTPSRQYNGDSWTAQTGRTSLHPNQWYLSTSRISPYYPQGHNTLNLLRGTFP